VDEFMSRKELNFAFYQARDEIIALLEKEGGKNLEITK
jgi:hypothetical protein